MKRFLCFCGQKDAQNIEVEQYEQRNQQKQKESSIFTKDLSGEVRILEEFWDTFQSGEESSKNIGDAVISEDLMDVGNKIWSPILEFVKTDSSTSLFKEAIKSFLDVSTVEFFLNMGESIPWFGLIAKMGSVIYLGVMDVYENQENCKKLAEFVKTILVAISQAQGERQALFSQAAASVNKNVTDGFEKYMSLGISIIARFTKRRNLMAFLMHIQDAKDFEQMSMMQPQQNVYINEFNKTRLEVENLVIKLGDGDVNRGLSMLSDYLKPTNGNSQDNNANVIFGRIRQVLDELPEPAKPELVISEQEQLDLNLLSHTKLPLKLSLQLKTFWWNKFGKEEQVEWSLFEKELRNSYNTFINSQQVQDKELNLNLGEGGFIQYVVKNMLDENQNGQISGAELRLLYEWCIKQWQYEEVTEGGYPPRTLGDILRTLCRHMDKAVQEIKKRQTLDLSNRGISADGVEQIVILNNNDRLPLTISLDVSRNPIGDAGARKIFRHRAHMPKLTKLAMEECKLGDALEGIQSLIPQLQIINLSENQIGDRGVGYIADGLVNYGPVEIQELDLQNNKISDAGIQKIIDALETDDCVVYELNLYENKISEELLNKLGELCLTLDIVILHNNL